MKTAIIFHRFSFRPFIWNEISALAGLSEADHHKKRMIPAFFLE
jgi:hypothetical protein